MDVHIDCQCGEYLLVSEGSAGATITCPCGRPLKVPSLKEFRLRAGLPAYEPSPEMIIQHQLLAGGLPPDRNCVHCGADTDQVVQVAVECEKAFRTGGFSWGVFLNRRAGFGCRVGRVFEAHRSWSQPSPARWASKTRPTLRLQPIYARSFSASATFAERFFLKGGASCRAS